MSETIHVEPNALKHGLTREQVIQAFKNPHPRFGLVIRDRDYDTEPQRYACIGFEHEHGWAVELVYVRLHASVLILHANRLTKGFIQEMRNAK